MQEILGILGGILTFSGFIPLTLGAISPKDKVPLPRATSLIWMVEGWVLFLVYGVSTPEAKTHWVLLALAFGLTWMFILSIPLGSGGWGFLDKAVLSGAGLTIAIWQILSPEKGLLAGIVTDAIGAVPILTETWHRPNRNKWFVAWWLLWWTGAIANLVAVSCWLDEHLMCVLSPEAWFPTYGIVLTSGVLGLTAFRREPK